VKNYYVLDLQQRTFELFGDLPAKSDLPSFAAVIEIEVDDDCEIVVLSPNSTPGYELEAGKEIVV
jgi:hypothetical protein